MSGRKAKGRRYDTLAQLVDSEGPVSLSEALDIVLALVDQVDALHAHARIHREIGVDAVSLDRELQPQLGPTKPLVPFGGPQADAYDTPPELRPRRRLFLPEDLEQARQVLREAGSSIDPRRIDIYQLGALLAHLLTGTRVGQYLRSPLAAGSVDPAARSVIDRALGLEAANRVASCEEFKQALRQVPESASQGDRVQDIQPKDDGVRSDPPAPQPVMPTPHRESQDLPFERLAHFRILERIGAGGMGDVYKAHDETLDRPVAIKVLPAELARQEEFVSRFRAEATAAARLAHPNIVPIYFIGQDGEFHFFAMQFVEGESLAERLRRLLRLPVDDAVRIVRDCLHGLDAAHRQGMIHRDIKPGNILIDGRTQRAMLADFGLVHRMGESTRLTATGMVLGTVDYIAPEQARGQPVDGRSDLYSLGVLLYQLLSGRLPFEADTPTAMLFQHAYEQPLPLDQAAPDVPASLAAMTARLMAKKPEDRYQQCRDVLVDLKGFRADEEISAPASEPLSSVILLPDFGATPEVPASVHDLVRPNWWQMFKDRAASLIRARAPALVDELQSTEQRVDGAVAEYERRRDRLAGLIEEAEGVARELAAQAQSYRTAAVEAEARIASATSESERREVQEDQQRLEQAAEEIEVRVAEQEEQLGEMRVRLAQVNARLIELRSQRDLLNARLKIARAQLDMAQTRPRRRRWYAAAIAVSAVLICLLGVALWGPWKTTHDTVSVPERREWRPAKEPVVEPPPVVKEPAPPPPPDEPAKFEPEPMPTSAPKQKPTGSGSSPIITAPVQPSKPQVEAVVEPFAPDDELLEQVANAPVLITDIDPNQGSPGHEISLQGRGFSQTQKVFFTLSGQRGCDYCARFQVISASELRVTVPLALGDGVRARITVVTPQGVTVTLPHNPIIVDRPILDRREVFELAKKVSPERDFVLVRRGGALSERLEQTTVFIEDGGTVERTTRNRCHFVQRGGALLGTFSQSVIYHEPEARLGDRGSSRFVEAPMVSLSVVPGLFEFVQPPRVITKESDGAPAIHGLWPRVGADGQIVRLRGEGLAGTRTVFVAFRDRVQQVDFQPISDMELLVEVPVHSGWYSITYFVVVTPNGTTATLPSPEGLLEAMPFPPIVETKNKVTLLGETDGKSVAFVDEGGVLSSASGMVLLKRGATLGNVRSRTQPVLFEPGCVILDPRPESCEGLLETPSITLSVIPYTLKVLEQYHHLTEQAWPIVDWIRAVTSAEPTWLPPLHSAHLRQQQTERTWWDVLSRCERLLEQELGVPPEGQFDWSSFDFLYSGDDSSGGVVFWKQGRSHMTIRVVNEEGEWKIDDYSTTEE